MLQEASVLTRAMLTELGLESWLKTSGGKGPHVVVPLAPKLDYEVVKSFSQAVVRHMAKVIPSRFVAVSVGSDRVEKIFIDYLRNGHGQTTASAFSARSRPGLGVSMPVSWEQLPELKGGSQWTIANVREYLSFQQLVHAADALCGDEDPRLCRTGLKPGLDSLLTGTELNLAFRGKG